MAVKEKQGFYQTDYPTDTKTSIKRLIQEIISAKETSKGEEAPPW